MKRELSNAERERMNQQIVDSCARLLWTLWWADQCSCGGYDYESCRTEGRAEDDPKKHRELGAVPGAELTEIAPPTPPDAFKKAEEILVAIVKRNKHVAPTILELYLKVAALPGRHLKKPTPEDFGACMAFEALGHGVGWSDDHPDHGLEIPSADYQSNEPVGDKVPKPRKARILKFRENPTGGRS